VEKFSTIFSRAAARHGGEDALRKKLKTTDYGSDNHAKSDDRWLSEFTKRIFQAGFNWRVVENKWDGFETAFWNFNIDRCSNIGMDDMEALTSDKQIVRNASKIKTVSVNAQMIKAMTSDKGSADRFIRGWPSNDYIGLLTYLNKNGSRLGPNTASYALRFSGVPSFILSKDVTAALIHADIINKLATSKTALTLSYVSRVLAHSISA